VAVQGPVKVPVVLQMSAVECGAACLSMVLRAYRIPATLADCRQHLDPGPKGVNVQRLMEVALKFGLRASAYSAKSCKAVQELALPAILHFGDNHFVVLESWSHWRDRISIVDPSAGRRKLGWSELLERHSGVALAFELSATPPTLMPQAPWRWRDFARRLLHLSRFRQLVLQLVAVALVLNLLGVGLPLVAAVLVDRASISDSSRLINILGTGLTAVILGLIALSGLRSRLLDHFGSRAAAVMALSSFQRFLKLPSSFSNPWALDESIRQPLSRVRQAVAGHAVAILADGLGLPIALLALTILAPPFCGIALAAAGLHAVLWLGWQGSLVPRGEDLPPGADPSSRALFLLESLTVKRADTLWLSSWRGLSLVAVRAVALLLSLWLGTHMVLRQQLTLGTLLAALSLATQFLWPMESLMLAGSRLRSMGPHIQALALALKLRYKQPSGVGKKAKIGEGGISPQR
jgi:ATP-binding cassette, subfamily B, bacterial